MKKRLIGSLIFLALTIGVSSSMAQEELVKNGSFDKDAAGWEITVAPNWGWLLEKDGNGYVGLNYNGRLDPTMTQTLSGLTIGAEYIISARYRNGNHVDRFGTVGAPFFSITVAGETREYKLLAKNDRNWKEVFWTFKAKGNTAVLKIEAELHGSDNDVAIDDVSVKPVKTEMFQIQAFPIRGAPGDNTNYFIMPGNSGTRAVTEDVSRGKKPANFVRVKCGDIGVAFKLYSEKPEGGLFLAVNDKHEVTFVESNDNNVPEAAIFVEKPTMYEQAGKGWTSFMSNAYPGHYLRHFQFKLDASALNEARNTLETYHKDGTWKLVNVNAMPQSRVE